jgi:hypothetical protein
MFSFFIGFCGTLLHCVHLDDVENEAVVCWCPLDHMVALELDCVLIDMSNIFTITNGVNSHRILLLSRLHPRPISSCTKFVPAL